MRASACVFVCELVGVFRSSVDTNGGQTRKLCARTGERAGVILEHKSLPIKITLQRDVQINISHTLALLAARVQAKNTQPSNINILSARLRGACACVLIGILVDR